jgi:hypothetical protein
VELWGFLWLMVLLKIPIVALLWLVWWAIHATPEQETVRDDDGGLGKAHPHGPRPLPPTPRRRGPHSEPVPTSPPRTRVPAVAPVPERR